MNYIYIEREGPFYSLLAAGIHLGIIEDQGLESVYDWFSLFFPLPSSAEGRFILMGIDDRGDRVYILITRGYAEIIRRMSVGLKSFFKIHTEECFVSLSGLYSWPLKLIMLPGSVLVRTAWGRSMLLREARAVLPAIKERVEKRMNWTDG